MIDGGYRLQPASVWLRITFANGVRVELAPPSDANSLAQLERNPCDGALFVLTNRRRDKLKILYWERNGFVLWYKRLERERFKWPKGQQAVVELTGGELHWLLDGHDLHYLRAHRPQNYATLL